MVVLEYLNSLTKAGASCYTALGILQENYGIKYSENKEYGLFVLNYDQIDSSKHKFEPIVRECRSLVLEVVQNTTEYGEQELFKVISRSFDRFFNVDENPHECFDFASLSAVEKADGSLIGLFYYKGEWLYRTKSMIMPETKVNGFETTWKEVIEESLNYPSCTRKLNTNHTYIFEVVSPENRVVVRYSQRKAYLLNVRDKLGFYHQPEYIGLTWLFPRHYNIKGKSSLREFVDNLPDMEEGVVLYQGNGVPVLKVKSKKYLVAHALRGEGLNPKRCMDLVIMGETDEYLAVFPEDYDKIQPYIDAYDKLWSTVNSMTKLLLIEDQKEFALKVKDTPVAGLLFSAKKGLTYQQAWDKITTNARYRLIGEYL